MMVWGNVFCVLLLAASRCRGATQVVFAELSEEVVLTGPYLPLGGTQTYEWPNHLKDDGDGKFSLLTGPGLRPIFIVKNFRHEDQGLYSVTTNGDVFTFRVVLATTIEAVIGATLDVDPKFSSGTINSVTWKYTPNPTSGTDLVHVLDTFGSRARVDTTTGKLRVSDWSWCDDGVVTVEINGQEFVSSFWAMSTLRLEFGSNLVIDPKYEGKVTSFAWYHQKKKSVPQAIAQKNEDDFIFLPAVMYFPPCVADSANCHVDKSTGKLTIKSWQPSSDGDFTLFINTAPHKRKLRVVSIIFATIGNDLQLDPPPFEGGLTSITWKRNSNLIADWWQKTQIGVEYYQLCNNDNCIFDAHTGRLTIKQWDPSESNIFTVEVNLVVSPNEYFVVGVKQLDTYDVSVEGRFVDARKGVLICGGDFDGAEPVKYSWRQRNTDNWVEGRKIMDTTRTYHRWKVYTYTYDVCKIKNPVSERMIYFG